MQRGTCDGLDIWEPRTKSPRVVAAGACIQTVLIVEDDPELRLCLSEILKDAGYCIATAEDGCQALQQLRESERRPCVILLDLMMPVMDGWRFRELQRADQMLSTIPVVAVSAVQDLRGIDADAALVKPLSLQRLLDMVERFCGRPCNGGIGRLEGAARSRCGSGHRRPH